MASVEETWSEFMHRCYLLGKYSIEVGILPKEDLEDYSPYLYLGIPGITLLQSLLRSKDVNLGFKVGQNKEIEEGSMPDQLKPLFRDMVRAKELYKNLKATDEEIDMMHQAALFAGESEYNLDINDVERRKTVNAVLAAINSVAIRISQQAFYLNGFNEVLEKLESLLAKHTHTWRKSPNFIDQIHAISRHILSPPEAKIA